MPKINYKSISVPYLSNAPMLLISEIENDGSDTLSLGVFSYEYSFVIIEGKEFKLRSGKAEIELKNLPRGICDVIFIKGTQRISASPVLINGEGVFRVPLDNSVVKLIEDLLVTLAESVSSAKERIFALEEKIKPKNMFKFT